MAETPKSWPGRNSVAEAGGGQGRHGQERVPDAFRRGDRSGASLAPEPTGTGIGQRHMAQPNTRSPAGGGKPDWRIATGTGHLELDRRAPASGKPGRRLLQNGYLSKWPVLGHQLHFSRKSCKGNHTHQRGASSPAACRAEFFTGATGPRLPSSCPAGPRATTCGLLVCSRASTSSR